MNCLPTLLLKSYVRNDFVQFGRVQDVAIGLLPLSVNLLPTLTSSCLLTSYYIKLKAEEVPPSLQGLKVFIFLVPPVSAMVTQSNVYIFSCC